MDKRNLKVIFAGLFAAAFLVLSISGSLTTAGAQEIKLPPIKKTTLDNGLKVIVIEHHELPVVAFRLVFKSGAASDPSGKAGLADLTAGLLRKGTRTRTATQIAEEIDFVGGGLGAGSSRDATYATCKVLEKHFDVGLDLLSDIILNPAFADEEIERLRKQTLAAIKQQKDNPGAVADEKYRKFLFGDHPYGQPSEGTETSVAALTRDDIVSFHRNHYAPNNAILAVVGDVKPKVAIKKVEAKFSGWKGTQIALPGYVQPPDIKGHQILLVDKPDLTQTYIRVGHLGIKRDNPDYFAVKVMNYILGGGGFSSRMMDEIRSKRGLTYGIGCKFDYNKLEGAYTVSTFTQNDSTAAAIRAIIEQIANFRSGGVTDTELKDTKSFYTGYFPLQLETPSQIASQILNVELHDLGEDYLKDYRKNINAVTREDIQRAAQKYLDPNNLKLVVVSKAEDVKASLEPLGSIEVTSFLE
ncbi:MAG: insulinase family protein [Candidatus Zixiibacteriota bacterium]|nr:MAG: insulinase family protein [candidate division Zixibacteria bacterium]